ncbi:hypothetical protein DPMN_019099 [Dreissena polymorpha]|uniref:Uncharacterized protein n=1 Tax=Dreissena polymorpha TaxID=45954 RepID=A0A9D4NJR0_DREPO|nr:hypothetical protein DPMN_019099 [Dreissena polymorpha]
MAPDTKVPDGRTARRTDNAKTISIGLWRGKNTHTKHFQDMAPDTKVPDGQPDGRTDNPRYGSRHKSSFTLPRYGSRHKSAGRTDSRTDGRTTPKQYPSASGGG